MNCTGLPTTLVYDGRRESLSAEAKDDLTVANEDRFTVYEYGTNNTGTQQTKKTVHEGLNASGSTVEEETYAYNLQGRMSQVLIDQDGNGVADKKLDYRYGDDGIRVGQTETTDTDHDGSFADETPVETKYLNDEHSPTGYARVIEEKDGSGNITKSYTLGHDVIAQADASNVYYLLKDGHGSTRALVNSSGQIVAGQVYAYDAFGNAIGFTLASAMTTVLYSGERTDAGTGLQYLGTTGGRYYRSGTGTFTTMDSFAGRLNDPQSLHKLVYGHGDGVNFTDPTGRDGFSLSGMLTTIHIGISTIASYAIPVLYVGWQVTAIWTGAFLVQGFIESMIYGDISPFTQWGLNVAEYAVQVLTLFTTAVLLYPRAPVRLNDTGGTRWGAVRIHQQLTSEVARRNSAVAVVEAEVNGTRQFYATGSNAYLTPAQRAEAQNLGIPSQNIFSGAQYRVAEQAENHAEKVIERNLPAGARIIRWGISWGEWPKLNNESLPFPCPGCTDTVTDSGGKIEVSSKWAQGGL